MALEKDQGHYSHPAPTNVPHPAVILDASRSGAWEHVGGIPLAARSLFHLRGLQIKRVFLLLRGNRIPTALKRWQKTLEISIIALGREKIPEAILAFVHPGQPCLYIDASHLLDPRLLKALTLVSIPTLTCFNRQDVERQMIRAGFLKNEDLRIWADQGPGALLSNADILFPEDLDPYSPEIRGPLVPYFMEIRSRDDAREATKVLIRSQQKHVMDFPAEFIDPPFENALTLLLCNTPVTPNMVTYACVMAAMGVAYLFWHGYLLAGSLGTFVVEILDGVDGKLARTKLQYSRLGRYEALIDYFCENSWYAALAVGLSGISESRAPGLIAGLLILSDTIDNILYTLAGKWYGKSIDLFSLFDAAFRRVAGRRNIYGIMFILGFLAGFPLFTFAAAAFWAALTASTHGFRLMQYGRQAIKKTHGRQAAGIP